MNWVRRFVALCCAVGVFALSASAPYAQDSQEYFIKAAFIYKFALFVEWPEDKAVAKRSGIDICVIGDSDLMQTGPVFQKASTPKLALSLVQEKTPANAISHCHIVFIGRGEDIRLSSILANFKSKPILTVSDIDDFAERGGMIGFVMVNDKVKLVINPAAAAAAGLRIDAQLLEIALRVIDK